MRGIYYLPLFIMQKKLSQNQPVDRPSRAEAMQAVETVIAWAGDNPNREGLIDTPKRVVDAYQEFFVGYNTAPDDILARTFEEVENYDEIILVKNIRLESHCEHHMVPIIGKAHVAYLPNKRVVGISKLARLVDVYGKRLQTQETMTAQIANTINNVLQPKGVHKVETTTVTTRMLGVFRDDPQAKAEFMALINN